MSIENNKTIVRRWFEEAWQRTDVDEAVTEFFAADYISHNLHGEPTHGVEPVAQAVHQAKEAIPDIRFTVLDQVAEGQKVVTRLLATGTHLGTLADRAPTGKSIRRPGMVIFRLVDGKIVESWRYWDQSYLSYL